MHSNGRLRTAIDEALKALTLHPESRAAVTAIGDKLSTTSTLEDVGANLQERKEELIRRHPEVAHIFKDLPD